eukprot:SAG11_NODE_17104_length_528_cov_1.202797_1_plen_106_part_00
MRSKKFLYRNSSQAYASVIHSVLRRVCCRAALFPLIFIAVSNLLIPASRIGSNEDGAVDAAELRELMRRGGQEITLEDAKELVAEWDETASQSLDMNEFIDLVTS